MLGKSFPIDDVCPSHAIATTSFLAFDHCARQDRVPKSLVQRMRLFE